MKKVPTASLSEKLNRKNIYILPSRHGFIFLFVVFAMLIGSVNYNNNLGFLLSFLLASIAFISIFYTSRNLKGIQIVSARAAPVFAGENAVFEFKIVSPPPRRPSIAWKFFQEDPITLNLKSDRQNILRAALPTSKRGLLSPGILTVETCYPLGLFRAWSKLRPDVGCLVYPSPSQTDAAFQDLFQCQGGDENKKAGVDDFQGLRIYQPGDSLRQISWKAYSRGQGLLTKIFEEPSAAEIFIDWKNCREPGEEKKLSSLCFLVLKAHGLNIEYGLKLPRQTIKPGRGENHKKKCLRALALFGNEDV